jgi:adenylate cyclase
VFGLRHCLLLLLLGCAGAPWLAAQPLDDPELEAQLNQVETLLDQAKRTTKDAEIESLARNALSAAQRVRYETGAARSLLLLGNVCARTERTEEALRCLLEAESRTDKRNTVLLTDIYYALGDLFYQEKLYETARQYYRSVLDQHPDDWVLIEKMGDAALAAVRFDTAEYYFQRLIRHYRGDGNNPRLVHIYQKLAAAHNAEGDKNRGLEYYKEIENLVRRFGTPVEQAQLYNNLGKQYAERDNYVQALSYFRRALDLCETVPCTAPEVLYANLGVAYHNTGDTKRGLEYLMDARRIIARQRDSSALGNLDHLIAGVYQNSNEVYNSLKYNELAMRYAEKSRQSDLRMRTYETAAELYYALYDFEKAFEYYQQYLLLLNTSSAAEMERRQALAEQRAQLANAGQMQLMMARQSVRDLELRQARDNEERLNLVNQTLALEARKKEDDLRLLQKQKEVDEALLRERSLDALKIRQELNLASQRFKDAANQRLIGELRQQESADRSRQREDSLRIANLRYVQDLTAIDLQKKADNLRVVYWFGALGLLMLALLGTAWLYARRAGQRLAVQNRRIQRQKLLIEDERQKSDQLLRNILPDEVAQELKTHGYATPRHYESATVVFTDFVNFTRLSAQLTPELLLTELDECFLAFDEICETFGLEKIKTIGDAYMCAAGLPVPNTTHPIDAIEAAIAMCQWLERRNNQSPNAVLREMRIGVHTGPVVAGVVGKNKFAYDIWGDAVNLAARMEEAGQAGSINISGATQVLVKDYFTCTYRGKKDVHNKGLVDMYFVEIKETG